VNGDLHEVGISPVSDPIVTLAGWRLVGSALTTNGTPVRLKLDFLNKGGRDATGIAVQVQSTDPQVAVLQDSLTVSALGAGTTAEGAEELQFLVQDPAREIVKLLVRITVEAGWSSSRWRCRSSPTPRR